MRSVDGAPVRLPFRRCQHRRHMIRPLNVRFEVGPNHDPYRHEQVPPDLEENPAGKIRCLRSSRLPPNSFHHLCSRARCSCGLFLCHSHNGPNRMSQHSWILSNQHRRFHSRKWLPLGVTRNRVSNRMFGENAVLYHPEQTDYHDRSLDRSFHIQSTLSRSHLLNYCNRDSARSIRRDSRKQWRSGNHCLGLFEHFHARLDW